MKRDLIALQHTLNRIQVSGENNLNMLLGCIQKINAMIAQQNEEDSNADDQNA